MTFFVLYLLSASASASEVAKDAQNVLKAAIAQGLGQSRSSGVVMTPYPIWRESYARLGGFEWDIYYRLSSGGKGEFVEKEVRYYRNNDVYYIFTLDQDNSLVRFQKKIQRAELLNIKNRKFKLDFDSFIVFDPDGNINSINQNLFLINNKDKEAYYSYITIDSNADIIKRDQGNYEYDQLSGKQHSAR